MAGILALLTGRVGQILLAFGAGMAFLVAAYQTGVKAERARGVSASLRSEIAVLKTDIAIAKSSEATAKTEAAALEAAGAKNRDALKALQDKVRGRPAADRCGLTAADIGLLLSIK